MKNIFSIMLAAMLLAMLGGCFFDPQPSTYYPIGEDKEEPETTPRETETPRGESGTSPGTPAEPAEETSEPETATPPSSGPTAPPPAGAPSSESAATPPTDSTPSSDGAPLPAEASGESAAIPPAETPPAETPATDTPASSDASPPATDTPETAAPETETETGPALGTLDHGVLVRAPAGYAMRPKTWESAPLAPPNLVAEPLAAGIFEPTSGTEPPGGNNYIVWAFPKREGETLEDWSKRSSWSDSFFPEERVETANGKSGVLYETGDMGLGPYVHAVIATERFVYRIEWDDNRIPKNEYDDEEFYAAIRRASENHDSYYNPPAHFLNFVRALEVQ